MRLIVTITSYPPAIGGAQLLMHHLACQLVQRHSVQVLTQWDTSRTDWLLGTTLNAPAELRAYVQDGVPVQRITLPAGARRRLAPWVYGYYLAEGASYRAYRRGLASELRPWAAAADLIHNCRIGREGLSYASLQAARERDIPFVFTPVHHPRWGGWLHRHFQALYRQADAVIALTEAERKLLVQLGVRDERIFVAGMGPVLAPTSDGARFRGKHGLGAAPLVWRRFPEAHFVFIGPRTSYSRRLFGSQTDSRLVELDAVDVQEKTDALAACTVLCVPSAQESFGGVYTEAWSLGKPVIGCAIPAVCEVISDGWDGVLVRREANAVADALMQILDDETLAAQMGQRGREKVAARFSWPRLAALTEAAYETVLGRRAA